MSGSEDRSDSFYVVGGTLMPDAGSYIRRRADDDLHHHVRNGEFCYVLTSRQMGKSSLMARTALRLRGQGTRTAVIDLSAIGTDTERASADRWYFGFAHQVVRQLQKGFDLRPWWNAHDAIPPLQKLTDLFGEVVLELCLEPVVIFVDEIDTTISLPFKDDFFAAVRSCHNRRAFEERYRRLCFVLLGVASPSELIGNKQRTPFNLGRRIELTDFTREEARPLEEGLRQPPQHSRNTLERILFWTGGHPYLTQRLCREVAAAGMRGYDEQKVDETVERCFLNRSALREDHNLRFVYDRLTDDISGGRAGRQEVLELYLKTCRGQAVPNDALSTPCSELRLSGVVSVQDGDRLRVRNRIYARVFDAEWVLGVMPVDWSAGDLLREQGDHARALDAYRSVAQIAARRAAESPNDAVRQRDLATAQERIGSLHIEAGRASEAIEVLRPALTLRGQIAAEEHDQPGNARDVAAVHELIAAALLKGGDRNGAIEEQRKSLKIRQELAARHPETPQWERDVARGHRQLGTLFQEQGAEPAAVREFDASLKILKSLRDKHPIDGSYSNEIVEGERLLRNAAADRDDLAGMRFRPRLSCPHCWHQFPPEEILWISAHPMLLGDARLGNEIASRFLPTRFTLGGEAIDLQGEPCNQLACPNCHLHVARAVLERPPFAVSILGAPGCGKSYFLATMASQLRTLLPRFGLSFLDADLESNQTLQRAEEQLSLGSTSDFSVMLPKTQIHGEFYQPVRFGDQVVSFAKPFLFVLDPMGPSSLESRFDSPGRVVCLYDAAGEQFLPGGDSPQSPTRHLAMSDAFLFLLDPSQEARLQGAGLRQGNRAFRQDAVLVEAAMRVRKVAGLRQHDRTEKPLVVVMTKADLVTEALPEVAMRALSESSSRRPDLSQIRSVSRCLREFLLARSPEIVSSAESFSTNVVYVPVSAFGVGQSGNGQPPHRPREMHPAWVEVPLLYALQSGAPALVAPLFEVRSRLSSVGETSDSRPTEEEPR